MDHFSSCYFRILCQTKTWVCQLQGLCDSFPPVNLQQLFYRTLVNGWFSIRKNHTYTICNFFNILFRGVFRTLPTCKMEFFAKIVNGFPPLTIFAKKTPPYMFDRVLNTPLTYVSNL